MNIKLDLIFFIIIVTILLIFIYKKLVLIENLEGYNYIYKKKYENILCDTSYENPKFKIGVYLINMDKSFDRLDNFKNQVNKTDLVKLNIKRFSAIDGKKINIKNYVTDDAYKQIIDTEDLGYRIKHYELTSGAVGCFLSHINLYKSILNNNLINVALIFEDDIKILDPKIYCKILYIIESIPPDWDIILLGYKCIYCINFKDYYKLKHFFLLHSYLINKNAIKKILAEFQQKPIDKQLDSFLSEMAINDELNIYAPKKQYIIQNHKFGTYIQQPIKYSDDVDPYELN